MDRLSLPILKSQCACPVCTSACTYRPGWFAPGEVAKAAALLGLSEQDFFDRYLGVDFWLPDDSRNEEIAVLAPATTHGVPGQEYPYDPRGCCVFFHDGRCQIHAAKPVECAVYHHDFTQTDHMALRHLLLDWWKEEVSEVIRLLGREPVAPEPTESDWQFF